MRRLASIAMLAAPSLLVACAAPALEDEDSDSPRSLESWVMLERIDADGQVRTNVSAKFAHVSEGDRLLAQNLVGVRPVVPAAGDCLPLAALEDLESPALLARTVASRTSGAPFSADLIDAGDVTLSVQSGVEASGGLIKLSPRAFPDVGDLVSGVFYTSPDADALLPPNATYALGATGSHAVDGLLIEVQAPRAPSIVSIAGVALSSDSAKAQPPVEVGVRVGADIELVWSTDGAADSGLVYVDLRGVTTHRCAFADRGAAVLPAELLSAADVGDATLTLHRLVEQTAPVRASDSSDDVREATVVFDFARAVRLTVE